MFQRHPASPAARPVPAPTLRRDAFDGGTLSEAIASLELNIVRLEDWQRRHGRDHGRTNLVSFAIEQLKIHHQTLSGIGGDAVREEPLVRTGQGTYTRELHGNPTTGQLNVRA